MEAHVHGHPPLVARVRERTVEHLAIADDDVPGAQTMGTASGSRSVPASATFALMSTLPRRWVPGTTHTPFAGVQP